MKGGLLWCLVVKNPPYNAGDLGSIPDRGTKISHAEWCSQEIASCGSDETGI